MFFLFLVSYKYSLFHSQSVLPYLSSGQNIPAFTKCITYALMMIGVPPTILLILYNTFLCHTTVVNWVVQTVCFQTPFVLSAGDGFFAYIIASLMSAVLFGIALYYANHHVER